MFVLCNMMYVVCNVMYVVDNASELTASEKGYALRFSGNLPISVGIDTPSEGKGVASFVNRIVRNAGFDDDIPEEYRDPNCMLGYNREDAVYYLRACQDIKPGRVLVTMYGSGGHRFG